MMPLVISTDAESLEIVEMTVLDQSVLLETGWRPIICIFCEHQL